MPQFNLYQAILAKAKALGEKESLGYFRITKSTLAHWQSGTLMPDVKAAQLVLDEHMAANPSFAPSATVTTEEGDEPMPEMTQLVNADARMPALVPAAQGPVDEPMYDLRDGEAVKPGDIVWNIARRAWRPYSSDVPAKVGDPGFPKVRRLGVREEAPKVEVIAEPKPIKPPEQAKKHSFLIPINRDMSYAVVQGILGSWKATLPEEMRDQLSTISFEPDTTVARARNILATNFLNGKNEWAFWIDSDMLIPFGNGKWLAARTGAKFAPAFQNAVAIERLTSYRGKGFVGAVYKERDGKNLVVCQPCKAPRNDEDRALAKKISEGPREEVVQVPWIGFGCVAVHRQVFVDILEKFPQIRGTKEGEPHGFFRPYSAEITQDDVSFCLRAKESGHPVWLDLSVRCGHVGRVAYI
jgi:hypothetical protein